MPELYTHRYRSKDDWRPEHSAQLNTHGLTLAEKARLKPLDEVELQSVKMIAV